MMVAETGAADGIGLAVGAGLNLVSGIVDVAAGNPQKRERAAKAYAKAEADKLAAAQLAYSAQLEQLQAAERMQLRQLQYGQTGATGGDSNATPWLVAGGVAVVAVLLLTQRRA